MLRPTGGGPRRPVAYTPRHAPPFSPPACLARAGEIGYDRVLFFSDAVFAIAITLLIVDLQVPDVPNLQSGTQLRESIPRMAGFALSFAAAGLAEAAVWLYAIHIRDLALPGVPPWCTAGSCCGSSRHRRCSCCRSRSPSASPSWASTCGSSPS